MANEKKKAWYYWGSPGEEWYILAFVNRGPSCSRRQFQVTDGKWLEPAEYRDGRFQDAFPEYWNGVLFLRLSLIRKPNLRDCEKKNGLPPDVLSDVKRQVKEWGDKLRLSADKIATQ